LVDWNSQFSSALELTEFLMCQGVLFSNDEIEEEVSLIERGKSLEALRENTQHENTNHLEFIKVEEKKELIKDLEKPGSPGSKENNENSYSDISTSGTNTENQNTPCSNTAQSLVADEETSPRFVAPVLLKQNSTPAVIETQISASKPGVSIEKSAADILTRFETSYVKLSLLILKDIDFIEWEPRVISAATLTFLRCINKVTPIWNHELEAITQLKFEQVSPCFEAIYKRYNMAFNMNAPKLQNVLCAPDTNRDANLDLKLAKANSSMSDKNIYPQPKFELATRTNSIVNGSYTKPTTNTNLVGHDTNTIDPKPLERKPIFNYQAKSTVPTNNTSSANYNNLRDDLRFRTRYGNGTINTEIPQRNPTKNAIFPSNYLPNRYYPGQDPVGNYNNTSGIISGSTASGSTNTSYLASGSQSVLGESFLKSDQYMCKNSSSSLLSNRTNSSFENGPHSSKLNVLKK